jgi:hypothetical protein
MSDRATLSIERAADALTPERGALLAQLTPADGRATLLSYREDDADALARRFHDVRGAVRRVALTVEAVRGGYRFDDASAAEVLRGLDAAVATLEAELELLGRLYP